MNKKKKKKVVIKLPLKKVKSNKQKSAIILVKCDFTAIRPLDHRVEIVYSGTQRGNLLEREREKEDPM